MSLMCLALWTVRGDFFRHPHIIHCRFGIEHVAQLYTLPSLNRKTVKNANNDGCVCLYDVGKSFFLRRLWITLIKRFPTQL